MKNLFLLITILFAMLCSLRAQDLIVTSEGDSINCKINRITKDYVYFTFKYDDEIRNTLLPVTQITMQQKNHFSKSELPDGYTYKDVFPHFRLAVDAGCQYRTAKIANGLSAEWKNHYKKMKSGFHYDIQAAYFFTELMGIELMFSQQLFGHSLGYGTLTDEHGNVIGTGNFNEKIAFSYSGANYLLRIFDSKQKNCWLLSIGLGYVGYKDRFLLNNLENTRITAATLGTNMSIGYDIGLSKKLALGFKASLMGGTFRNYRQTANGKTTNKTMPDKTAEGLGTLKLSVGLRFNK